MEKKMETVGIVGIIYGLYRGYRGQVFKRRRFLVGLPAGLRSLGFQICFFVVTLWVISSCKVAANKEGFAIF